MMANAVAAFCRPILWMHNANIAAAVKNSRSNQAKWKGRTLKQLTETVYEIVMTSGGIV